MECNAAAGPGAVDAYTPREIARRVEAAGVTKARTDALTLFVLAILAGAFISLGALFFLVVVTQSTAGFGVTRLLGGVSFSLGLILTVIAGAELFTGNNLLAMAWASGLLRTREVVRNWLVVYAGNVVGCAGTVALAFLADVGAVGGGGVGDTVLQVARAKVELTVLAAAARGVLCNALVCLAVWLAMGGRSVTDKVMAIVFPITAFVTIGLEHSIANWFFLPLAVLLDGADTIPLDGVMTNLAAVTAGNILGGTVLVAGIYWVAYLRRSGHVPPASTS